MRILPADYLEAKTAQAQAEARKSFWAFRKHLNYGRMQWGWWLEHVAVELQNFYEHFKAGGRPKVALMAPSQHGKSWTVTDFIAWVSGKDPDNKTIYASYSDELGVRTNRELQRIFANERYQGIFPLTRIGGSGTRWQCNNELIEFVDQRGSFRNTTVMGAITGMGLDLGVIDDPIKGRAEAQSRTIRERTWNWVTDDFCTRFAADGAMLLVQTRWHVDDPVGRLIERFPGVKVLRYPAICERDDNYRKQGEPLFPELKPLEFLLEQKRLLSEASWEAMYQQRPCVGGWGIFPIDKLRVLPLFDRSQVKRSVRYFDKAATAGGGAYTAGVVMHQMLDNTYVISHVARGQWGALERERNIKILVHADARLFGNYEVGVEQEPGSGGKESAEATIRMLAGHRAYADRVTGSKEARAEPFAAQVQGGNVYLVAGDWVKAFLEEAEIWPHGKNRDQIDAASGAFNHLIKGYGYDATYAGF